MRLLCIALTAVALRGATLSPEDRKQNLDSFEYVWTTIRDKHWDKSLDGAEWKAAHDELRPKMEAADSRGAAREVLSELIGRLHLTHFGIIPNDIYSAMNAHANSGLDVRVIQGKALIVSGKHAGWEIAGMDDLIARVGKQFANSTMRDLMLARAVDAAAGAHPVKIRDGRGAEATVDTAAEPPRGEPVHFGNLPTEYMWVDYRLIDAGTGYFAFNIFLNPESLIGKLRSSIESCNACSGFIVDLRGNPGGIGGMAMGMAGFFVSQPNQQLGTMYMRDTSLKFFINPRQPQFTGKLAILVDGSSASTSEIFAGGLQDLGRARVFGTRTAGAALPSVIERLPNGDGFQYAIANYISEGGKPLEGNGVRPDEEVALSQESLLAGHDSVLEAALHWLKN